VGDYESVRREACRWVRQAGKVACRHFGRTTASAKADASPVTEADHVVQEALQEIIARTFPGDAVITEETQQHPDRHARPAAADRCWIIDPIDGTRNYARTIPVFSISLALLEKGRPVVGVVGDPITENLWSASAGAGLWLNHVRCKPQPALPATGWLIASPSGQRGHLPPAAHRWIDAYNVRNLGSTALHLVYLASGGFDAVLVTECHAWDIAGAWVMIEEAGMVARPLDGPLPFPMNVATEAGREISFLAARPEVMDHLWQDLTEDYSGRIA